MTIKTLEIKNDLWTNNLETNPLTEELTTNIDVKKELSNLIDHDFTQKNKVSDDTSSLIEEAFELDKEYLDIHKNEIDYTNPKKHEPLHKNKDFSDKKIKTKKQTKKPKKTLESNIQKDIEQYSLAA